MRRPREIGFLFASRSIRLFAYGLASTVLALHLAALGYGAGGIGLLLSLTLVGDTVISLGFSLKADAIGRRQTLILGAGLMALAGLAFAMGSGFALLCVAATIGVISPSGNEVGPFLAIEQAALAQVVVAERRPLLFAWYHLAGAFASAGGALAAGWGVHALTTVGWTDVGGYRAVFGLYGALGILQLAPFLMLGRGVEVPLEERGPSAKFGLHRSRAKVLRLCALFSLDSFGGGFVVQAFLAYWFHVKFGARPEAIGSILFGANLLSGLSGLPAAWLARRIGLVNTMVWTHLPSNVLLAAVPFMPNFGWAIGCLLARFSISQMDVPTRQAFTIAVVEPDERSAAAGMAGVARTIGASLSPILSGSLVAASWLGTPFGLAGGLKIVYDLLLLKGFRDLDNAAPPVV
ncbi:MAG: MFS transporter [Fimbriimonas ginsengisoli]|uniref:MFS transporter n=1 Tax=Fimbriimonas ginsengisoli TaxID=1005039 RepID=A0A931PU09_FIMGI|nr:MFS transporter [Fimbriimonas ginsengisoli]